MKIYDFSFSWLEDIDSNQKKYFSAMKAESKPSSF